MNVTPMDANLMDESDLVALIRSRRRENGLTQTQLANRMVEAGWADSLSKQAISKAENPKPGDGMTSLRVALVEELTEQKLRGPLWASGDASRK